MKKLYRRLFELFSWLGWVTGYERFTDWACICWLRSATLMTMTGKPVSREHEKQVIDELTKLF